jgi:uncharacterized membrane protein
MARRTLVAEVTVSASATDVYHVWNQRYQYPRFMAAVHEVEELDETWSRWVVVRDGSEHRLDVETTDNVPRRLVAWRDNGPGRPRTFVRLTGPDDGPITVQVELRWHPGPDEDVERTTEERRSALDADLAGFRRYLESEVRGLT